MLKRIALPLILALGLGASGCTLQGHTYDGAPELDFQGWGTAFAQMSEIRDFDGRLLRLRILGNSDQPGELVALHIWPLGDLDLGLFGVRGKLLVFEAGAGTLLYYPQPEGYEIGETLRQQHVESGAPE